MEATELYTVLFHPNGPDPAYTRGGFSEKSRAKAMWDKMLESVGPLVGVGELSAVAILEPKPLIEAHATSIVNGVVRESRPVVKSFPEVDYAFREFPALERLYLVEPNDRYLFKLKHQLSTLPPEQQRRITVVAQGPNHLSWSGGGITEESAGLVLSHQGFADILKSTAPFHGGPRLDGTSVLRDSIPEVSRILKPGGIVAYNGLDVETLEKYNLIGLFTDYNLEPTKVPGGGECFMKRK